MVVLGNLTIGELYINSSNAKLLNYGNIIVNSNIELAGEIYNYKNFEINTNLITSPGSKLEITEIVEIIKKEE